MRATNSVIGVTGAFSHSISLCINVLQRRDWVIGKKANFWGIGKRGRMSTDDKARAEDKPSLDYAEPRIIVQARAELQTCLIVMPSAADNLEEEEEDEANKNKFFLPLRLSCTNFHFVQVRRRLGNVNKNKFFLPFRSHLH